MNLFLLICAIVALSTVGYFVGRSRALSSAEGKASDLHSLPSYYGAYQALWGILPALAVMLVWLIIQPFVVSDAVFNSLPAEQQALPPDSLTLLLTDINNLASGNIVSQAVEPYIERAAAVKTSMEDGGFLLMAFAMVGVCLLGMFLGLRRIAPNMRARNLVEKTVMVILIICSTIAIATTIGIIGSLIFESYRFFAAVSPFDFVFGLQWSPQTALRADQVGSSGAFGAIPLFTGTLLITVIAMTVAAPVGLLAAIYLSDYASNRVRAVAKPILEILAGIPTVVYGFFAALTVAPLIRDGGAYIGLDVASESALAAGIVMGIMIIPFVSSLSDDVINSVPNSLREGAFGLGATKSECIKQIVLPAALPGIFAALLLATSRAIGETMIVVMAAGFAANLTFNPIDAVTTVTVQIVKLLTGDTEFDTPKTLSAFALGLVLFIATLAMNVAALRVVRKYREKYD